MDKFPVTGNLGGMQEIEERIRPVIQTGENARVVALVNQVRALAAGIMIEARLGDLTINHERIGTPEQRNASMASAAARILYLAQGLYPNQEVLHPPEGIRFLELSNMTKM